MARNSCYIEFSNYKAAKSNLGTAISDLHYSSSTIMSTGKSVMVIPAHHPDAAHAKAEISGSLRITEPLGINSDLTEIINSLPDQDDVKEYNGQRVSNSTFEQERDTLENAKAIVGNASQDAWNRIPKDTKEKASSAKLGLALSLIVGVPSFVYGATKLTSQNYD
jgi:hypothetical protein